MAIINQRPTLKLASPTTWESIYATNNLYPEGFQETGLKMDPLKLPTASYLKAKVPTKFPVIKNSPVAIPLETANIEKESLKALDKSLATTTDASKGLSTIQAANIATGISTGVNVATSIYGAIQASKMKPEKPRFIATEEPTLLSDRTSAIQTAGENKIEKQVNTVNEQLKREGKSEFSLATLSKSFDANNDLSFKLQEYRNGIASANAQVENQFKLTDTNNANQNEALSAQIGNQFKQYQSGLIGMAAKNATDAIQSGTESIFNNIMAGTEMNLSSISSEIRTLEEQIRVDPSLISKKELMNRLSELKQERSNLTGSIYNTKSYKV